MPITIVLRTFLGTTKLGLGGVIRSYIKSVNESIEIAKFSYLKEVSICTISIPFEQIGNVESFLRDNFRLIKTDYLEGVTYHIEIDTEDIKEMKKKMTDLTKGKAVCKVIETKIVYK